MKLIITNDMKEIWKDIKGYEDLYQISNLGNVKSLKRITKIHNTIRIEKEKILKLGVRNGYYIVQLNKNNKRKSYQVHRLVAQAFLFNYSEKLVINHKDYNKLNNNINNLECCTQKENVQYSISRMRHRHNTNHSNTGHQYITYRKSRDSYRITIDKKEYGTKTLGEAIILRDKLLKGGD